MWEGGEMDMGMVVMRSMVPGEDVTAAEALGSLYLVDGVVADAARPGEEGFEVGKRVHAWLTALSGPESRRIMSNWM